MRIFSLFIFCFGMIFLSCVSGAEARSKKSKLVRAPGAQRLGPWVEKSWQREDWSRAPAVRNWGDSAPANYDTETDTPSISVEYPWGYTAPFTRVGTKCIANELNESPGGLVVRYQRVLPSYYCR